MVKVRLRDRPTLTSEKQYFMNLTEQHKKFCLGLHCNEVNSCIVVNGVEIHKFQTKDSEINAAPLCLDNISKTFFSW